MTLHKPLMFLDYYWRAYRLCGREPANVYHAHDLNTLPVAAAAARSTGGKLVYDAHELYTEISTLSRRERRVWRRLERLLIGRADATISVCDSIAEELSKRYGVQRPTVVLNCPSGPRPVSRRPELLRRAAGLRSEGAAVVLYQGGFVPHRGLPELVRASRWFDGATLVMMGWGRLEQELRRLVEEEELAGVVRFAPPVSQRELLTHSAGADVGVIPYQAVGLNNFYTTPNKLFEYMAAGLPIAASRFPELVRFVEGLEVGRTFDPTRPRDIAAAVNGILADDAARDAMRERALAAARTYCWEREAPRVVDLYAGLAPAGLAVAQR